MFVVAFLVDEDGFHTNDFEALTDGGRYKLGRQEPKAGKQQPRLTAETYYRALQQTIVLSRITSSGKEELLEMLALPETGASLPNKPATLGKFPSFEWLASGENSSENRAAYIAHLRTHVRLPADYSFADVQPTRGLLNARKQEMS